MQVAGTLPTLSPYLHALHPGPVWQFDENHSPTARQCDNGKLCPEELMHCWTWQGPINFSWAQISSCRVGPMIGFNFTGTWSSPSKITVQNAASRVGHALLGSNWAGTSIHGVSGSFISQSSRQQQMHEGMVLVILKRTSKIAAMETGPSILVSHLCGNISSSSDNCSTLCQHWTNGEYFSNTSSRHFEARLSCIHHKPRHVRMQLSFHGKFTLPKPQNIKVIRNGSHDPKNLKWASICPTADKVNLGSKPKSKVGSIPLRAIASQGWMCRICDSPLQFCALWTRSPKRPFSAKRCAERP